MPVCRRFTHPPTPRHPGDPRAAPHRPRCPAVRRRPGRWSPLAAVRDRAAGQPAGPRPAPLTALRDRRSGGRDLPSGWYGTRRPGPAARRRRRPGARSAGRRLPAEAAARRHLDRVGARLRRRGPATSARPSVTRVAGRDVVRFQQTRDGLPVLGGQLVTVLDGQGGLLSVSGETAREAGPAPAYDVAGLDRRPHRAPRRGRPARRARVDAAWPAGRPAGCWTGRWSSRPRPRSSCRSGGCRCARATRLDVADLVLVDARIRSGVALRLAEVAGARPRGLRRPARPSPTGAGPGSTTGSRAARRPASPTPTRPTTSAAPPRTGTPARSASTSPR